MKQIDSVPNPFQRITSIHAVIEKDLPGNFIGTNFHIELAYLDFQSLLQNLWPTLDILHIIIWVFSLHFFTPRVQIQRSALEGYKTKCLSGANLANQLMVRITDRKQVSWLYIFLYKHTYKKLRIGENKYISLLNYHISESISNPNFKKLIFKKMDACIYNMIDMSTIVTRMIIGLSMDLNDYKNV